MNVDFRLLGVVEARIGDRVVDLGPARQRCVLVTLLIEANRVVLWDQLVDRVWAGNPPHSVRTTLHSYVSRLRKALSGADDTGIVQQSGGYMVVVPDSAIDVHRFRRLIADARNSGDEIAMALFQQAFELWRGPDAFAGMETSWLVEARSTLDQERFAARLDYFDVALRHGRHPALLPEMTTLAGQRPLDERLAGQLMLALYRNGRQAEALEHYQRSRSRLAEELGADPSPPLQDLHRRILAADPVLARPADQDPADRTLVPRQLPAAPVFVGRAGELRQLTAAVTAGTRTGATAVISAIGGTGGIGKTTLALHWAHENAELFPDGQLFVNLRGFDPSGTPMPPATAIRCFLDGLGVAPAAIPADPDAQTGLYRSLVAGKRMLILLDNAADTGQVTPLLPASPTCMVLITSRDRLPGVVATHGVHSILVDALPEPDASALLAARLGARRLAAEPDVVREILSRCAGMPLALSIVAGRAVIHPDFPLAVLAAELRSAATRMQALDDDDTGASVRAVLSWSAAQLPAEHARVFGLLGLAPGPDISLLAVASLTGLGAAQTGVVLRALERASLVHQHIPGRYRMHDLVRLYAAEHARNTVPEDDRTASSRRLVDFYVHTALAGERLLNWHRPQIEIAAPVPGCEPQPLTDEAAVMAWFDAEHACLLATQQAARAWGSHDVVWQLAWTLTAFHWQRGRLLDDVVVWRAGLDAARQAGDPDVLVLAYRLLGNACGRAGRHTEAVDLLAKALNLAEQAGDVPGQAHTHYALAWSLELHGDDRRALEHADRARRCYEELDIPISRARALSLVGWFLARLGEHAQAQETCETALTLHVRHGNRDGEAHTLNSLGYIAHQTGRYVQAMGHYQEALDIRRELGNTYGEANTLENVGRTQLALGHQQEARSALSQALQLYRTQHRTADAERVGRQLTIRLDVLDLVD